MNSEIARIHREGVISELEQIGKELDPKYSLEWFESVWSKHKVTIPGFIAVIDGEVMLYVDSKYQRKGLGSSLLVGRHAIDRVWIIDGNKKAESFYTKNGFKNTGKARNSVMFGHEVTENLWERGCS